MATKDICENCAILAEDLHCRVRTAARFRRRRVLSPVSTLSSRSPRRLKLCRGVLYRSEGFLHTVEGCGETPT